jgi:hypothetical protein
MWYESVIRNSREELPATWPVLDELFVDDENRLWIATLGKDENVYTWWLTNEFGRLLAQFTWPRDREIKDVKGGYLYARETDNMDVSQIIRYSFELRKK